MCEKQAQERAVDYVERKLGYTFRDRSLLRLALTHPSADTRVGHNNQRLEFLGDSILGAAVTMELVLRNPDAEEGVLTIYRSNATRREALAEEGRRLGLHEVLRVGQSAKGLLAKGHDALIEDAFEALVGAIFQDAGWHATLTALKPSLDRLIAAGCAAGYTNGKDSKTQLQEWLQGRGLERPVYETTFVPSGGFNCRATAVVTAGGARERHLGRGHGRTKKAAEKAAAQALLNDLIDRHGQ